MGAFKYQALNNVVVIKPYEVRNITQSGIDITSSADKNSKYRTGEVVSVGHDIPKNQSFWFWKRKPFVKVGDKVSYDFFKHTPFYEDGEEYHALYYPDLFLLK